MNITKEGIGIVGKGTGLLYLCTAPTPASTDTTEALQKCLAAQHPTRQGAQTASWGLRLPLADGRGSHNGSVSAPLFCFCHPTGWGGRKNRWFLPWIEKNPFKGQNNWKEITGKDVRKCADSAIIQPPHHAALIGWRQYFQSLLPHSWAPSQGIHSRRKRFQFSVCSNLSPLSLSRKWVWSSHLKLEERTCSRKSFYIRTFLFHVWINQQLITWWEQGRVYISLQAS